MRFFYQGAHQHTCIKGSTTRATFRHAEQLLALQQAGLLPRTSLMPTDRGNSVLEHERRPITYTPYGHAELNNPLYFGFNGQQRDAVTGHYLLGNGYRAYSPALLRFLSPDSQSPFLKGGRNTYAYVEGDPINQRDPSGHNKVPTGALVPRFSYTGKVKFVGPIATFLAQHKTLGKTLYVTGHSDGQKMFGYQSLVGLKPEPLFKAMKFLGLDPGAQPISFQACNLGANRFIQDAANLAGVPVEGITGPLYARLQIEGWGKFRFEAFSTKTLPVGHPQRYFYEGIPKIVYPSGVTKSVAEQHGEIRGQ